MTRILVLDADASAALTIVQSLGRAGYEITVGGSSLEGRAMRSRYAHHKVAYPDPLTDRHAFIDWLARAIETEGYALVIPPTERTLAPMHDARDRLGAAGRALPPADAWETCVDKERMRALAAKLGVPTPENVVVRTLADLEAPTIQAWLDEGAAVLKTVRSKTWHGSAAREHPVEFAYSRDDLLEIGARMLANSEVQVQRWVPGHGIGVELLADHGEIVLSFAHERVHEVPLTGGGSSYRRSCPMPDDLYAHTARLIRELAWHGVAMVEFRSDGTNAWMMEMNGRFWGSLPLAQFAGVDFPLALVRLLLDGERPTQPEWRAVFARDVRRDVTWWKAMTKVRLDDLRGRRQPSRRIIIEQPLGRSALELLRIVAGKETWDGAALDDPRPVAHDVYATAKREVTTIAAKLEERLMRLRAVRAWHKPPVGRRVLVVCSGNICRSAYAVRKLREAGVDARGAALEGPSGRPTPDHVQEVSRRRGVELSDHRSEHVTDEVLEWADLVLVMEARHERALRRWPQHGHKMRWLGALTDEGPVIVDPIDLDAAETDAVLDQIDRASARLVSLLR